MKNTFVFLAVEARPAACLHDNDQQVLVIRHIAEVERINMIDILDGRHPIGKLNINFGIHYFPRLART